MGTTILKIPTGMFTQGAHSKMILHIIQVEKESM